MIVLKVIGIILAVLLGIVFLLILLLAAADWTLRFRLEGDTWSIQIGAFPILARVFPMKKKKKKEKPPSPKTEKRKKAAGKVKKQAEEAPEDAGGLLRTLGDLAAAFFPPAAEMMSHIRFRKVVFLAVISEPDAASTAIRYGKTSAELSCSAAAAQQLFNVRFSYLGVRYDFLHTGTRISLSGDIRLRGIHIISMGVKTFFRYLNRVVKKSDSSEPESNQK